MIAGSEETTGTRAARVLLVLPLLLLSLGCGRKGPPVAPPVSPPHSPDEAPLALPLVLPNVGPDVGPNDEPRESRPADEEAGK